MAVITINKTDKEDKKIFTINDFRGVDFSNSMVDVSPKRASYMLNMINDNGINRKRNGWVNQVQVSSQNNVMGCFLFPITVPVPYFVKTSDTDIVSGKDYYTENGGNVSKVASPTVANISNYLELSSYQNKKLDVLATLTKAYSSYYYISFNFEVMNEDGWQIDYSSYGSIIRVDENENRFVNQYFYNKDALYVLVFGEMVKIKYEITDSSFPNTYHTYIADYTNGYIQKYLCLAEYQANDNQLNFAYVPTTTIGIGSGANDTRTSDEDINLLTKKRKNMIIGEAIPSGESSVSYQLDSPLTNVTSVTTDTTTYYLGVMSLGTQNIYSDSAKTTQVGTITSAGLVTLTTAIMGNITIEFMANIEDMSSDIKNCNFGFQFGAEGTEDRLWLSGNKGKQNYMWYSEIDRFDYFPASNNKHLPSIANEIVAFSRLSDNTLAIHSKTDGVSPTIYYITPRQMELDGEHASYEFPMVEGVIGEIPLSMNTAHALMGDSIYLSRNGVFGITLGQNISSIERYEHLRSRYVNKKLLAEPNLENATAIVYGNRYYLAVNDHVYIADARWKVAPEQSDETTFEYEWWYWEDVPVRQWLILNDELWFLDKNNFLCQIDNKFTDRTIQHHVQLKTSGDYTLDTTTGTFTYNQAIVLANDDTFSNYGMTYDIATEENANIIFNDEDYTVSLVFNDPKYLKEFSISNKYHLLLDNWNIIQIDTITQKIDFELSLSSGIEEEYAHCKQYYNQSETFKVYEYLNAGQIAYITDLDTEHHTFKLKRYSDSELTMNIKLSTGMWSNITHYEPIKCKWMTPALSFGYLLYAKNLYGVSIVLDPSVEGLVNFGYTTARTTREQGDVVSLANEKELVSRERLSEYALYNFDFNNIDFTNFSFETGAFACSRNIKLRVRNFTFIMFKFENNTKGNFAMNSFQLLYDIGKRNKGVR